MVAVGRLAGAAHGAPAGATAGSSSARRPYDGGTASSFSSNANGTGQVQLTRGLRRHDSQPAWSPNGSADRLRVESAWRHRPLVGRGRRQPLKELTFSRGFDGDPTWNQEARRSPSRRTATATSTSTDQRRRNRRARRPTIAANDTDPAWSPDGTTIAFTSDRTGRRQIWSMRADGTDQQQLTNAPEHRRREPGWSPRGGQIAFDSDRDDAGNLDIWTMSSDGSNQQQLTNSPALDALPPTRPTAARSSSRATATAKDNRDLYRWTRRRRRSTGSSPTAASGTSPELGPDLRHGQVHDQRHDPRRRARRNARRDVICGLGGRDVILGARWQRPPAGRGGRRQHPWWCRRPIRSRAALMTQPRRARTRSHT